MQPSLHIVCTIRHEVDIYVAIGHSRDMAARIGFNAIDGTRIEIAILELCRNLIVHAGGGELILEQVHTDNEIGIAIEACDNGPGIEDIDLALRDGYSTKHSLGAGLPGVKRLMDAFTIESTVGVGTRVRVLKWPSRQSTYHSMKAHL